MTVDAQVPDRNLALDLCRVTEAAALAASRWMGRGDKEGADGAAVDAMRHVLDTVAMDGIVIIGEGEKDEAPMLFNGERIGNGQPPAADIAVDPIDGTTLTSLGRANAIAVIAAPTTPAPTTVLQQLGGGQPIVRFSFGVPSMSLGACSQSMTCACGSAAADTSPRHQAQNVVGQRGHWRA